MGVRKKSPIYEQNEEFKELSLKFCEYLKKAGIARVPFRDSSLPLFSNLLDEDKRRVLEELRDYLRLFSQVEEDGFSVGDSPQLLWRALSRMSLAPCDDIFEKLEEDDIIAVYSVDHYQIFRNLKFFEVTSVTVEEICSLPWFEIIQIPRDTTEYFMKLVEACRRNEISETFDPQLTYITEESIGEKWVGEFKARLISPVKLDGNPVGLIVVYKGRVLSKGNYSTV